MTGKSTLALLGAAAALAGYVLVFEMGAESHDEIVRASRLLVPGLKPADVTALRIRRPRDPAQPEVMIVREGTPDAKDGKGKWRLVTPVSATADPAQVDGALSNLELCEKKQTLPGADPKQVGLAEPRLVVDIQRGDRTTTVELGEEDPVSGKQVYARVRGDGAIHAIGAATFGSLDRKANDFRDRAVMTVDFWSVSRASIAGPGGKVAASFKKDGEPWLMDVPEPETAERSKVEEMVRAVTELRAKEFVAEPADAAALKDAGLDAPRFTITLEAGAEKQALEVGRADAEKRELYVRRAGSPTVVTVDDALARHLVLDPEQWRSPLVLAPSGDRVEAVEVRRADQAAPLARIVRGKDGDGFTFAAPRTATADPVSVEGLINDLRALTVISTAAKQVEDPANFGLDDRHALVVTLETARARSSFRLGKASARENGFFVQREGKSSAQEAVIDKVARLRSPGTALRDRTLIGKTAEEIARVDISRSKGGPRAYVRLPDGKWTTPEGKADDESLGALAADLAALRAERIFAAPDEPAGSGLAAPWLKATVSWRDEKDPPAFVALGKVMPEGDGFHARFQRGEETVYFVAARALVDALDKEHVAAPPGAPAAPTGTAAPAGASAPTGASDGATAPAAPAPATPAAAPEAPK